MELKLANQVLWDLVRSVAEEELHFKVPEHRYTNRLEA